MDAVPFNRRSPLEANSVNNDQGIASPGGGETICPRRWQFDGGISFRRQSGHHGSKNRAGSTVAGGSTSLVAGGG